MARSAAVGALQQLQRGGVVSSSETNAWAIIDRLHAHIRDLEHDLCMSQPRQLGGQRRSIVYNGVEYPSIQAAAEAHGITRQAMAKRLQKGVE